MVAAGGSLLGFLAAAFLVIYPDTPEDDEEEEEEEKEKEDEAASIRPGPGITVEYKLD